jgi:uncharacterized protein
MPTPQRNSDRIVIVGTSSVAKTSFAKRLAAARALPRIELDSLYWGRHWQPKPEQEFFRLLRSHSYRVVDCGWKLRIDPRTPLAKGHPNHLAELQSYGQYLARVEEVRRPSCARRGVMARHSRIVQTNVHIQGVRQLNPQQHGLDFVDAPRVFDGPTYTYEDDRFNYPEQRFVTLGLLEELIVSIVHTETTRLIRIISSRKATKHEQTIFFRNL